MYSNAILKLPASNFADGLTSVNLGLPDYSLALKQHQAYQMALTECGLDILVLPPDMEFPDSTFIEDSAIIVNDLVIFTRPGATSRLGEVSRIQPFLKNTFKRFVTINSPGTLDGGDICEAGTNFFIGLSARTNETGASQLKEILNAEGYETDYVDIRDRQKFLHLKSGLASIGNNNLVVAKNIADHPAFRDFNLIIIDEEEQYAANCILVNDYVLIPEGYPTTRYKLQSAGYNVISLDMSEFQKMDGGLSCLSLRY